MNSIEQWAKKNEYYGLKLIKGKKSNWLEYKLDIGIQTFTMRRKIYSDKHDLWITEKHRGKKYAYYIKWQSLVNDKLNYNYFEEKKCTH